MSLVGEPGRDDSTFATIPTWNRSTPWIKKVDLLMADLGMVGDGDHTEITSTFLIQGVVGQKVVLATCARFAHLP